MDKLPIIIDCDPGTDDIAAIMLAKQLTQLDVLGLTTVAGNVELAYTTQNALRLLSFLQWDIPVAKGAGKPLTRSLLTAADIHGTSGMQGLALPETQKAIHPLPAWDFIYETARATPGLAIVAIGPLTNLATALMKYPDLPNHVTRIIIMGGGFFAGNTTPSAEFNILVDPEAAKRVFESGIPFDLCPLDMTHKAYITKEELEAIAVFGSPQAEFFAEILLRTLPLTMHYAEGKGVPLHDPAALLFVAREDFFTAAPCFMGVETQGTITNGKTVTDYYSDAKKEHNGRFVHSVNRDGMVHLMQDLIREY